MIDNIIYNTPFSLGAKVCDSGIVFSHASGVDDCGVLIFDRKSGKQIDKIPFKASGLWGNVKRIVVYGYNPADITYAFYENKKIIPDDRGVVFPGKTPYGKIRSLSSLRAGFLVDEFDWENDRLPDIPYNKSLIYCMHVRGFTRHSSSKVEAKGTFRGAAEKVSYLKELGVTAVELMPSYEFIEMDDPADLEPALNANGRLNYWGYKKAYYFAPKAAYSYSQDVISEFKDFVKTYHKNGIEVIMQFFFPEGISQSDILYILRYWRIEYHIDGFRLIGENVSIDSILEDPYLSNVKILFKDIADVHTCINAAEYKDDFIFNMRKFLKGDEGMVDSVMYHLRHVPHKKGKINYLSNYNTFTLMDMISYDWKHNEDNGENNRDGSDYNCSWNCGEEGQSRKKKVNQLRIKQYKNAVCMLLLSQGTPLIFMGDEFGNSQKGNNNPYCQDNPVSWLNWNDIHKNEDMYLFFKKMVNFRKECAVFSQVREPLLMDYIACGYPDMSFHGNNAWRPQTEAYSRCLGIMYTCKYVDESDDFYYVAFNMHWDKRELGLPRLPKGNKWKVVLNTNEGYDPNQNISIDEMNLNFRIDPRSVIIFKNEYVPLEKTKNK